VFVASPSNHNVAAASGRAAIICGAHTGDGWRRGRHYRDGRHDMERDAQLEKVVHLHEQLTVTVTQVAYARRNARTVVCVVDRANVNIPIPVWIHSDTTATWLPGLCRSEFHCLLLPFTIDRLAEETNAARSK
jgi:hypothetical protein